jgi:hypothetical protein
MNFLINGVQYGPTLGGSSGVWTPESFKFVADGSGQAKVEFLSLVTGGLPSYGNEIDNVTLSAVPEPATWTMLFLGLGMVGAAMRRRAVPAFA